MKKQVIDAISEIKGGRMMSMATYGDVTMNKTNNPYYGRVTKFSYYTALRSGCDYRHVAHIDRSESLPYGQWTDYPRTIEHKGNHLFRVYPSPKSQTKVVYFVDGIRATEEQVKEIKTFMRPKDKTICFNVNVDKIVFLKYDRKVFVNKALAESTKEVREVAVASVTL